MPIGLDSAGPENPDESVQKVYLFNDYKSHFDLVNSLGVPITLHAGESSGPSYVRDAINSHACRIGHGTRIQEDKSVMDYVRDKKVTLEMCPTSNTQTNVHGISKTLEDYPIIKYINYGIRCTICTDDPLMSDCTLSSELQLIYERLKLQPVELLLIIHFGFEAAFAKSQLHDTIRQKSMQHNIEYLKQFDKDVEEKFNKRLQMFK